MPSPNMPSVGLFSNTNVSVQPVKYRFAPAHRNAGGLLHLHQFLPQQPDGLHRPAAHARVKRRIELIDQRGGLPILAQQLPAASAGANARQQFVLFSVHGLDSGL